jgi:hypothetical protein
MKTSDVMAAATTVDDPLRTKLERLERSRLARCFAVPPRRRALVCVWATCVIALPVVAVLGVAWATPLLGFATWAGAMLLRHVVFLAADLPDSVLDERQARMRDRAYLSAYRMVGSVIPLSLIGVFFAMDLFGYVPATGHILALGWSALTGSIGAPSAALAWLEPDGRSASGT